MFHTLEAADSPLALSITTYVVRPCSHPYTPLAWYATIRVPLPPKRPYLASGSSIVRGRPFIPRVISRGDVVGQLFGMFVRSDLGIGQ